MFDQEIYCEDEASLIKIAREFAPLLRKGDVCLLEGEMGSGKTFFTTHVYEALGGDPRAVTSPSYSLVNEYPIKEGTLYHVDLYRLNGMLEEDDVSQDSWMAPEGFSFIEWAGRFPDWRPDRGYHINLWHLERGRGLKLTELS